MRRFTLQPDDQVYFLHIPKTAGTSFYNVLYAYFPDQARVHYHANDLLSLPESLAEPRLIVGHTFYTIHHYLAREPICITMLREPVAHMISHFRHIQREPNHILHHKFHDKTLVDFLTDPEAEQHVKNLQTLNLAVDADPRDFAKGLTAEQMRYPGIANWLLKAYDQLDEQELLERVKARLEKFAFVGITGRFEDSVALLTYTFHWQPFTRSVSLNRDPNPSTDTISQEASELIAERTRLDREIYQFALDLLETRHREMMFDLLATDHEFIVPELTQDAADITNLPAESARHLNEIHGWVDGWVGPRWSISTRWLPRQTRQLHITGTTLAQYFSRPLKLTILVGGTRIDQVEITREGTFSLTIPLTGAPIEIVADQYFIPAQVGLNADDRTLSWLIVEMRLTQ